MLSGATSTAFHRYSSPTRSTFSVTKPLLQATNRRSLMFTIRKKRSKHLVDGKVKVNFIAFLLHLCLLYVQHVQGITHVNCTLHPWTYKSTSTHVPILVCQCLICTPHVLDLISFIWTKSKHVGVHLFVNVVSLVVSSTFTKTNMHSTTTMVTKLIL